MVVVMDDEERRERGRPPDGGVVRASRGHQLHGPHGRGLICLTLTEERCRLLRLPPMVQVPDDQHGTNFTVSIEAARGVTTGSRHKTVRTRCAPR
jgi:3,4-dihydroxy 2-butanone 4-phosphate synthase/GTP cyclohydrolase II